METPKTWCGDLLKLFSPTTEKLVEGASPCIGKAKSVVVKSNEMGCFGIII